MKTVSIFLFLVLQAVLLSPVSSEANPSKPNIIFIIADDLGWMDTSFMGYSYFETPRIDQLATEGIHFTNAYANAANCAPSRACLMSGQQTPRHGIYTVSPSTRGNTKTRRIIPTPNTEFLDEDIISIPEMLRNHGYRTGHVGKWHIGMDARTQGFDLNVAGSKFGSPAGGYYSPWTNPYLENGPEGEYLTDRLTDEAIRFVTSSKDEPFFLNLAFHAVHTPLQGYHPLVPKYEAKPRENEVGHVKYGTMVERMDYNIGRLLDTLDELKLAENTVVVFTSDNGGIRSVSTQEPLRAGKGSYYEGGIRVPLVIRWPGIAKPNTSSDVPVTLLDIFPTLLDHFGDIEDFSHPLDGQNLLPLIRDGATPPIRPLFWHFPIYLQSYDPLTDDGRDPLFRTRPGSCIRLGKWKLHHYFEDDGIELYDLSSDLGERHNLATDQPAIATHLLNLLEEWRRGIQAPVPTEPNPQYDAAFEKAALDTALGKSSQ